MLDFKPGMSEEDKIERACSSFRSSSLAVVDQWLEVIPAKRCELSVTLSVLSITKPFADELVGRSRAFNRTKVWLLETKSPEEVDELLYGLE